jgi:hypothetical protein
VLWIRNHNCYGHHCWVVVVSFLLLHLLSAWSFDLVSIFPPPWFVSYFCFDGGIGVRWERKGKEGGGGGRRCGGKDWGGG